jgi:hypothetical protein
MAAQVLTAVYVYPALQPFFGSKTLANEPVITTRLIVGLLRADRSNSIVPCMAGFRRSFTMSSVEFTENEAE